MQSKFEVYSTKRISATALVSFVYEGVNEAVQEGLVTWPLNTFPVDLQGPAIYAVDPNDHDVVGVITYSEADNAMARVTLIYVEPSSRRKGVFKAMHAEFMTIMAENDFRKVHYAVHHNDPATHHAMASISARVGFKTFILGL